MFINKKKGNDIMDELRLMYECFRKAFEEFDLSYDVFSHKLSWGKNTYLTRYDKDNLVGFAIVRNDNLCCLCVDPLYQNKGIGSSLLKEAEDIIKANGFNKVNLGGGFFLACPLRGKDINNNFFSKRGYIGKQTCYEMKMDLDEFDLSNAPINNDLDDVIFKYNDHEFSDVTSAVAKVSKEWVKFFHDSGSCYIAEKKGKVVGFCNISFDDPTLVSRKGIKVGNVGCVGVIPSARKAGIGLTMVAYATNELKKHNVAIGHIHYTDLEKWYSKLGYKTYINYWFGYKRLR